MKNQGNEMAQAILTIEGTVCKLIDPELYSEGEKDSF